MAVVIRRAERKKAKMRIGLSGASGSGKTKSALLMAYGITGNWNKIFVIDTENGSADLYSDMGKYDITTLEAPYTPEAYIECIKAGEDGGYEVIVVDSITHEWAGKGGCLEITEKLGGKYQDWSKVTPRHNNFIDAILQSKCHIITTVRSKQDYDMTRDASGKVKVEKVGTKEVTREGFEYELTVSLTISQSHYASVSKDRTELFSGQPDFIITADTGKKILEWCNSGADFDPYKDIADRLATCIDAAAVMNLWANNKVRQADEKFKELFTKRKLELEEKK